MLKKLVVKTNDITGLVQLPASKSINNRVLIIDALTEFNCKIRNQSTAQDTVTLSQILNQFSKGDTFFDVGHAGTTMRFLTAFFSLQKGEQIITGSERMKQRPISILVNALNELGADIEFLEKEGYPPLKIKNAIPYKNIICIDGGVSSQYISALMLIAPLLKNGLTIELKNEIVSRPYVDMTKNIMQYFGANVSFIGNKIEIKPNQYMPKTFFVEGDWSSASYWYSVVALSNQSEITINSLKKDSLQGDRVVAQIYSLLGVETKYNETEVVLSKTKSTVELPAILCYDFSNCPDLAQTVAVTCMGLGISCEFTGLKTLKIKETDRLLALKSECEKVGAEVKITANTFEMKPGDLKLTKIKTYDDHRMAMAFAPLSLKLDGLSIEDSEVVKKSYPTFWNDFSLFLK